MAYDPNVNYRRVARRKAIKYGLDPDIFERQIGVESIGYRPDVISGRTASPAGAQGIAQIMPATARGWGVNPLMPRKALDAAAKHMAEYVRQYGSYENALRAYNAGPGAIQASHGYAETNNYVQKILNGEDPGHLDVPRRPGRGGGAAPPATARVPSRQRPDAQSSALDVPPADVSGLAALLGADQEQPQAASPLQAPEFSAARYLSQGLPIQSQALFAESGSSGLASQLAALAATGADTQLAGAAQPVRGGGAVTRPSRGPGKTLVVGDSLGVGTVPELRELGLNVKANVKVGRSSETGVGVLRHLLEGGDYKNIVFDLGTNDGSAKQLAGSLREALRLAPDATFYVPTVNGPAAAEKNRVIKQIARNNPNVELVRWHGASKGGSILSDGIHGAYDRRANVLAGALGFDPRASQPRPAAARGNVTVLSGADRSGVPTRPVVKNFLSQVSGLLGSPVTISTGSNHSQMTDSGNVSDHWTGHGADLGSVSNGFEVGGRGGDRLAAAAIRAATGMSQRQAMALARQGGYHNFTPTSGRWKGRRIQIIWRAPDHWDHVHVGIK